jgi:hypothetical protein
VAEYETLGINVSCSPLSLRLPVAAEDGANVRDEAEGIQDWEQVQQGRVARVIEPGLDRYCVV